MYFEKSFFFVKHATRTLCGSSYNTKNLARGSLHIVTGKCLKYLNVYKSNKIITGLYGDI